MVIVLGLKMFEFETGLTLTVTLSGCCPAGRCGSRAVAPGKRVCLQLGLVGSWYCSWACLLVVFVFEFERWWLNLPLPPSRSIGCSCATNLTRTHFDAFIRCVRRGQGRRGAGCHPPLISPLPLLSCSPAPAPEGFCCPPPTYASPLPCQGCHRERAARLYEPIGGEVSVRFRE